MTRVPEDRQEEFQAEQQEVYMALAGSLVGQLPEDWFAARLELSVTPEGLGHSISDPDGSRDIITPSDDLYAATLRLQQLFQNYECMFRTAVFDVSWDDTEENRCSSVEYTYDQET
jgi:hypothetical protein